MQLLRYVLEKGVIKLFPLALFALIIAFALYGIQDAAGNSDRMRYDMTLHAINRALADCYAIEGYYPPNMDYLYDNYNLNVDSDKYIVDYSVFAPNIRPVLRLLEIK